MQQLDEFVPEYDLAGRGRDVFAERESVGRLADRKLAFAAIEIFKQIVETVDQVLAVALQSGAQHFGIGQHEIGRRDGVDELLRIEFDAAAGGLIQIVVDLGDGLLQPVRRQQVGLLDEVEDLVFLPVLVPEALVAGRGRHHRLGVPAHHAPRRALPERHIIAPQIELRLHDDGRVGHHPAQQFRERAGDVQRVERLVADLFRLPLEIIRQQLLRLDADAHHVARELAGVADLVGFGFRGQRRAVSRVADSVFGGVEVAESLPE